MSYSSTILGDAPVAYWRLQETSGTTLTDSSGNGHGGTYGTGITLNQTQTGVSGDVSALFSTTGKTSTTTGFSGMAAFSVEAWFYPVGNMNAGAVISDSYSNGTVNYVIYPNASANTLSCGFYDGSFRTVVVPVTLNAWNYIAMTYDGSTLNAYVNAGTPTSLSYATATAFTGTRTPRIGADWNNSAGINGYVQEVAIYNKSLTPSQVSAHYAAASGVVTPQGTITASGTSSATVAGSPLPTGTIHASGTSNAIVRGPTTVYFLSPTFPAMFSVQAKVTPTGTISASGSGVASVSGTPVIVGSIISTGSSSTSITGTAIVEGTITASGSSSVSITGSAVSSDQISAQGTSTATVSGFSVPIGQVSAQGQSSATVRGHTIVIGSLSAQGSSSASVSGSSISNGTITAQGSSSVNISGVPVVTVSIVAQGVSNVTIESSGAVFGSITAGGTSVVDIEGHTVVIGQIDIQGNTTVVVSTAKPIRAIINLLSSLDNTTIISSSLDNRINLQSGVMPLAAVNQNFNLWQYSSDEITFTHSGDLSGCSLEWIMQPNINSPEAQVLIKKTTENGGINITNTSVNQSVYIVTITNSDMAPVTRGNYYHQATVVDGQQESNPICQGTVTVVASSNN